MIRIFSICLCWLSLILPCTLQADDAITRHIQVIDTPGYGSVWLFKDDSLPLVTLNLSVTEAGAAHDTPGQEGLARLSAAMWNYGGSAMDNKTFRNRLDANALELIHSTDKDALNLHLRGLKANFVEGFALIAAVLAHPGGSETDFQQEKEAQLASLRRNLAHPSYVAATAWAGVFFKDHPYGRPSSGTEASLKNITLKAIRDYQRTHITRDQLHFTFVGDITKAEIKQLLADHLDTLPATRAPFDTRISMYRPAPQNSPIIQREERPAEQATTVFGLPAPAFEHPDFYPLFVLNHIVGGAGLESILMEEVRKKRGLTYDISTFMPLMDHAAILQGSVSTRPDVTDKTREVIMDILHHIHEHGIMETQLTRAKRYLTGAFALRFDSSAGIAQQLSFLQQRGLSANFLNERNRKIEAVTTEDIRRVAQKWLNPDHLLWAIVEPQNPAQP